MATTTKVDNKLAYCVTAVHPLPKEGATSHYSQTLLDFHAKEEAEKVHNFCFPQREQGKELFSPAAFCTGCVNGDIASLGRNTYNAASMAVTGTDNSVAMTHPLGFPSMFFYCYLGPAYAKKGYDQYEKSKAAGDTTGQVLNGLSVPANASFGLGGISFVPARVIDTVNIFKPVSSTAMSASTALANIGGVAFGVFYVFDLISNSYKLHKCLNARSEIAKIEQDTPGSAQDKAMACLDALKQQASTPEGRGNLVNLLGESLVREIESGSTIMPEKLLKEVNEALGEVRNRCILGIVIDILGIATTILGFFTGTTLIVGTALTALTALLWIFLDILPLIEAAQANGKGDMKLLVAKALMFAAAAVVGALSGGGEAVIIFSVLMGVCWLATLAAGLYKYNQAERIDVVAEVIDKICKRRFEAAKELLKLYETAEKRERILKHIREKLDIALHPYLNLLSNNAALA